MAANEVATDAAASASAVPSASSPRCLSGCTCHNSKMTLEIKRIVLNPRAYLIPFAVMTCAHHLPIVVVFLALSRPSGYTNCHELKELFTWLLVAFVLHLVALVITIADLFTTLCMKVYRARRPENLMVLLIFVLYLAHFVWALIGEATTTVVHSDCIVASDDFYDVADTISYFQHLDFVLSTICLCGFLVTSWMCGVHTDESIKKAQKRWQKRCSAMFCACTCRTMDEEESNIFENLGNLFGKFLLVRFKGSERFESMQMNDLTLSLRLVSRSQEVERAEMQSLMSPNRPFNAAIEEEMLERACFYGKFAIGIYGWPVFIWYNPFHWFKLLCCFFKLKKRNNRGDGVSLVDEDTQQAHDALRAAVEEERGNETGRMSVIAKGCGDASAYRDAPQTPPRNLSIATPNNSMEMEEDTMEQEPKSNGSVEAPEPTEAHSPSFLARFWHSDRSMANSVSSPSFMSRLWHSDRNMPNTVLDGAVTPGDSVNLVTRDARTMSAPCQVASADAPRSSSTTTPTPTPPSSAPTHAPFLSATNKAKTRSSRSASHQNSFVQYTGIREESLTFLNSSNFVFQAPYGAVRDDKRREVIICIRGSLSFYDYVTDSLAQIAPMRADETPIASGTMTHEGMLRTARTILTDLREGSARESVWKFALENCLINSRMCNTRGGQRHASSSADGDEIHEKPENPWKIVVCGHSLGAGVAGILALLLKKYFPDTQAFLYAPPMLFDPFTAQLTKSFITTFVYGDDLVPRLSVGNMTRLRDEMAREFNRVAHLKLYYVLFGKSHWENVLERSASTQREAQEVIDLTMFTPVPEHHELDVPGRIVHITTVKRPRHWGCTSLLGEQELQYSIRDASYFRRIWINRRVISDHFWHHYDRSIKHMLDQYRAKGLIGKGGTDSSSSPPGSNSKITSPHEEEDLTESLSPSASHDFLEFDERQEDQFMV